MCAFTSRTHNPIWHQYAVIAGLTCWTCHIVAVHGVWAVTRLYPRQPLHHFVCLPVFCSSQGGFTATNSTAYKALFSANKTESAENMELLLLAGDPASLRYDYNQVQCNEAYTGVMCGRCREGYGGSGNRGSRCYKCLSRPRAIVVWLLSRLFDLAVVGLSVWYRRMQVKIKSEVRRCN